jgi:hypothetical protein
VGTSGRLDARFVAPTASALILPARMWGFDVGIVATAMCAWPDITSSSAGAPPL